MGVTAEQYKELKTGNKSPDDIKTENKQAAQEEARRNENIKDFIISRTNETVSVPVEANGETRYIEIYARLPRSVMRKHKTLMDLFNRYLNGDENALQELNTEEGDKLVASFLDDLTTDTELDYNFWMRDDIDETIVSAVLLTYFTEPLRRQDGIQKFRKQ